jgi:K+-sensing histidine kinase KdpD
VNTTRPHGDPVIDFILGRDGARLSFAAAVGITFVSCLVLAAAAASGLLGGARAFGGFVVIVVIVSWWSSPVSALALAVVALLFANGFAVDTGGTLAWHGEADLLRLLCLLALAVTASILGRLHLDRARRQGPPAAADNRSHDWWQVADR